VLKPLLRISTRRLFVNRSSAPLLYVFGVHSKGGAIHSA